MEEYELSEPEVKGALDISHLCICLLETLPLATLPYSSALLLTAKYL